MTGLQPINTPHGDGNPQAAPARTLALPVATYQYPSRGWKRGASKTEMVEAAVATDQYPSRGWKPHLSRLRWQRHSSDVATDQYPSRGWKRHGRARKVAVIIRVATDQYPSRGWKPPGVSASACPGKHGLLQPIYTPHGDGNNDEVVLQFPDGFLLSCNRSIPLTGMETLGLLSLRYK